MIPRLATERETKILGVLAGRDMPAAQLARWAVSAEVILAADAGLDRLEEAGHRADWLLGDLDSVQNPDRVEASRQRPDRSTETTDCDKLLAFAWDQGFAAVTLASVEGDQLDHVLATLHSAANSPLAVRLALRTGVGWMLRPETEVVLRTAPGRRVSLLPIEPVAGARLAGVEWPLGGIDLHPRERTSISNRAASSAITASIGSGSAFLFLEIPIEETPIW